MHSVEVAIPPTTTTPTTTTTPPIPGFPLLAIAIGTTLAISMGLIVRRQKKHLE